MTTTVPPVEAVSPTAPLEPPEPAHLPEGSRFTAVLVPKHDRSEWSTAQEWLAANGFHTRQLIAVPGIWLFAAPDGQQWVVVDYQVGSEWTEADEQDMSGTIPRAAKAGLQLNSEAGRCAKGEPGWYEAARDRHVRPLVVPVPAGLADRFSPDPTVAGRAVAAPDDDRTRALLDAGKLDVLPYDPERDPEG